MNGQVEDLLLHYRILVNFKEPPSLEAFIQIQQFDTIWPIFESRLTADGMDVAELKRRNEETKGMKADSLFYENKIAEYEEVLSLL